MKALIIKEFRELARDRRTVVMLVAMPLVLLVIFGYAANFAVDRISTIIVGPQAQSVAEELEQFDVAREELAIEGIEPSLGYEDAVDILRNQEADAVIVADTPHDLDNPLLDRIEPYLDGSRLFTAQAAQSVFARLAAEDTRDRLDEVRESVLAAKEAAETSQSELAQFGTELAQFYADLQQTLATGGDLPTAPVPPSGVSVPDLPDFSTSTVEPNDVATVLFNPDLNTSWVMVPGLVGLILLFVGVLITSIGLVRERETGTLEQLAVMPLRASSIIAGKIIPYFLLALLDVASVTVLALWLFDIPFLGSPWLFAATAVTFLFVVLGIGVFISSVSQNSGQAIQMAILFMVPQVLLSGLIFPLESMPIGVRWIGFVLPLTWFREVAQAVMLKGTGIGSLWLPLVILAVMAVAAFSAATARMRHMLTHGGTR